MLGAALGTKSIDRRLLIAGAVAAMLPDLDVIGFKLGIAYHDGLGHRGATHSILFALAMGALAALAHRWLRSGAWRSALFVGLATVSHPLLDACTNGGLGVALLWPFSEHRWFFPVHPIAVSPIGVSRFMGARGLTVMASELVWVWLPTALVALGVWGMREWQKNGATAGGSSTVG